MDEEKVIEKLLGKKLKIKKDLYSKNQGNRFVVRNIDKNKYMIFDNELGEFLVGYSFNNSIDAQRYAKGLNMTAR